MKNLSILVSLTIVLTSSNFALAADSKNDDGQPKLRKPIQTESPKASTGKTDSKPQLRKKIDESKDKKEEKPSAKLDKSKIDKLQKVDFDNVRKPGPTSDVPLGLRMTSTATGFVLGMPISIVRCFAKQTQKGAKELYGEHKVFAAPAYIMSAPLAVFGAPVEGVYMSAVKSWQGSGEEAFGLESFSLGEWDDID